MQLLRAPGANPHGVVLRRTTAKTARRSNLEGPCLSSCGGRHQQMKSVDIAYTSFRSAGSDTHNDLKSLVKFFAAQILRRATATSEIIKLGRGR
jgi:hypothetical protein